VLASALSVFATPAGTETDSPCTSFPAVVKDATRQVTILGIARGHKWKYHPDKDAYQPPKGADILVISYKREPVAAGMQLEPIRIELIDTNDKPCTLLAWVIVGESASWRAFEIPAEARPKNLVVDGLSIDLTHLKADTATHDVVGFAEP